MPDPTEGVLLHEAVLVHPTVDTLSRAVLTVIPASWQAVRVVVAFGGTPPVISNPDGASEVVTATAEIVETVAALDRIRREQRTGWTVGVLMARRDPDGPWRVAIDWRYGGLPGEAPPSASATSGGAAPEHPSIADGTRHQTLVTRAEAELAANRPGDAMGSLGEALIALPGHTFEHPEAGWIFVRMAGIRLGLGDPRGAARNAESALRCAGWQDDARALLRLGQAQRMLGDPAATSTLLACYRRGGDAWFASVAPELLAWVRAACDPNH